MKKTFLVLFLAFISSFISCQTNNDANNTSEFESGSTINTINLSHSNIENLTILGKVWGFLKYYHPVVAKGSLNWDLELFKVMPKIIQSKTDKERNELLSIWIRNLGNVEKDQSEVTADSTIKIKPDLSWITDVSILGNELSSQLVNIRDAKREDTNHYVRYFPETHIPEFTNEELYFGKLTECDARYRILSLFRYWNIVQYFFPYKNLIEENWDDVLSEFIPKLANASSDLEYKLTLLALIARIHDSHTMLGGERIVLDRFLGENYAPFLIKPIENKAVVTDYLNASLAGISGLKKGDIIISVSNKTIEEIINKQSPITPSSNHSKQLQLIFRDLLRTNDTIIDVEFQRKNLISSVKIRCYPLQVLDLENNYLKSDTCFKLITSQIAYINPGTIRNDYLPKIMNDVQNTRGLIVDMRCYPSDFIVFSLGDYLMPDSTAFVKFTYPNIIKPGLFTFDKTHKVGKRNADYYKGKVVIIVNESTMSNAEYTAMALRVAPEAIIIGSQTAGADGNVAGINLPGGIVTGFSSIGVYYPDGKETQRIGIVPDIEVKPTILGIRNAKDELLEKAIELIKY